MFINCKFGPKYGGKHGEKVRLKHQQCDHKVNELEKVLHLYPLYKRQRRDCSLVGIQAALS